MTGLPSPQEATQAVGMPATLRSILKPSFSRMPVRYLVVSNSWKPSSPKLKTLIDHDLRLLLHGVDLAGEVGLHGGFFIGGDFGLRQSAGGAEEQRESEFAHSGGVLLPVLFSLSREGGSLGTSSRGSSAVDGWEETHSTQQVGHCRLRRIRD